MRAVTSCSPRVARKWLAGGAVRRTFTLRRRNGTAARGRGRSACAGQQNPSVNRPHHGSV